MKSILGLVLLLSIAAHAKPSGPVQGPVIPITQEQRGKYLIWTLLGGDSATIASYFQDSVKENLTPETIKNFRAKITWLSKLTGDSLEQFMTGTHLDSTGRRTLFFREYVLANVINKRAPLIVIHVLYRDSTAILSEGIFVKTFLEDSEKKLAGDLTWKINGKNVDIHSVTLIQLKEGYIFAVKVYDDSDTTTLDSITVRRKGVPIIREAIAQGFMKKAKDQLQGQTLLDAAGIAFIRKDPHMGYLQFKYGLAPRDYEVKADSGKGVKVK